MKCNFIFKPTLFSIFPERQNHARELIREISLPEWDGIVIVSGDGLLHEVSFTFVLDKSVVQGRVISSECIIKVYIFFIIVCFHGKLKHTSSISISFLTLCFHPTGH